MRGAMDQAAQYPDARRIGTLLGRVELPAPEGSGAIDRGANAVSQRLLASPPELPQYVIDIPPTVLLRRVRETRNTMRNTMREGRPSGERSHTMLGAGDYPITIAEMRNYTKDADEYFEFEEHEQLKGFLALNPERDASFPTLTAFASYNGRLRMPRVPPRGWCTTSGT